MAAEICERNKIMKLMTFFLVCIKKRTVAILLLVGAVTFFLLNGPIYRPRTGLKVAYCKDEAYYLKKILFFKKLVFKISSDKRFRTHQTSAKFEFS